MLFTGGAGFIGSHLADRCLRMGFEVRILDNLDPKVHPHGKPSYLPVQAELMVGSVTDPAILARALRGIDVVFHQAAHQDYMPDFSKYMDVNVVGTALIYETIVRDRLPVRKVVVASSQAVYGEGQYTCREHGFFLPAPRSQQQLHAAKWEVACPNCGLPATSELLREPHINPFNQYAVSKLGEEKTAIGIGWLYGIPTVAMRYSITQGPRQSLFNSYSGVCRIFFSRALQNQDLLVYEDGLQRRDFVHVEDVVDANMLVLERDDADYQAFNVGSGKPVTVLEYGNAVIAKTGSAVPMRITGEYRRGDNRHSVSSVEKLQALGWTPKRDLSQIMDDFLKWIDEIGGIPAQVGDAYTDMKTRGVVLGSAAK